VIDSEGGNPVQVTRSGAEDLYPHWSDDGKWLIYASDRTGRWELWRAHPDGSDQQQVTTSGAIFGIPERGGRHLYFARPGRRGIWVQASGDETAEPKLIVDDLAARDCTNWGVTRHGVYYIRRSASDIFVAFYDFASHKSSNLYPLDRIPFQPAFSVSADGREIAFTRIDEDAGDIQMVETLK
jgi:WD40-like Beta Propeller Repeat